AREKVKTRSYQHRQVHATAALVFRIVGSRCMDGIFMLFYFILFCLPGNRERARAMKYRALGRTGWKVSEISFGAWAIGGFWGHVSDEDAISTLHKALDSGINFIDTADVYGDGRSERLIARLKKERKEKVVIATKVGRRLPKQTAEGYSRQNLATWINDSLHNLEADALDLLQ